MELRIHNVTPKFMRELIELGFDEVEVDEIVEMSIHHVTPRFIREMRGKYGEALTLDQLLDMRLHGVDEICWRKLRAAGVKVKSQLTSQPKNMTYLLQDLTICDQIQYPTRLTTARRIATGCLEKKRFRSYTTVIDLLQV